MAGTRFHTHHRVSRSGAPSPGPAQAAPPPGHRRQPPAGGPALHHGPPAPGMLGAAHKPGAIPLRPLDLGDMYDGAFRIIRFNPKATVGSAVLVAAVAMAIPVLVTAAAHLDLGLSLDRGRRCRRPGGRDRW